MIANCQQCGAKTHSEELFCQKCGTQISGIRVRKEVEQKTESSAPKKEYREPTMTLRMTIFFVYFGMFMSLAATGVFFIYLPPTIIITVPIVLLEYWIARNLGKYRQKARYLLIVLCAVTAVSTLIIYVLNSFTPGLAGSVIFLMATYGLYAMLIHEDTMELYRGKYQPDPNYSLFV